MLIADRILDLLASQNMTQKSLSEKISVATSTMNSWLKYKRDIPAQYIMPICRCLNTTPEYLLEGESPPDDALLTNLKPPVIACADDDEQFLVSTFRALDSSGKRFLLGAAETERRRALAEGNEHSTTA